MASLARLFELVDPLEYYSRVLGKLGTPDEGGNIKVKCPFHIDSTESLSIKVEGPGGVYNCFGCKARGNIVQFHQRINNLPSLEQAAQDIYNMFNIDERLVKQTVIPEERVAEAHSALLVIPGVLKHLASNRGIDLAVVKEYKLGYEDDGRVTIPAYDVEGNCVSLSRWLPEYARTTPELRENKMLGVRGHNSAVLYPLIALQNNPLFMCEGELDCLLLRKHGFNAITSTKGVNSFRPEWLRWFRDKDVYLVFDNDAAGRAAAADQLHLLYPVVRSIHEVWFESDIDGKDITDVWKAAPADFEEVVRTAVTMAVPYFKPVGDSSINDVNLYQAAHQSLIGKQIRVRALVVNKGDQPLAIPRCVQLECTSPNKNCPGCPAVISDGTRREYITPDNPAFIDLITTPAKQHGLILKELFGVECKTPKFEVLEMQNVEDLVIMPEVDMSDSTVEFSVRTAYYAGYGLTVNEVYEFIGTTVVDPRTNVVTHVFSHAEQQNRTQLLITATDLVECDGVKGTVMDLLTVFQPSGDQNVFSKLHEIYCDLESNVTKITRRTDVLRAVHLLYHSPIGFIFDGETIIKGWMDVLILGDTATGKSKTVERFRDHLRAGEVYSGENISKVGIIGGYIQVTGSGNKARYVLGVWPLNDCRAVFIDEFSGLPKELISELTMLRDHGIAESTKMGQRNRHPARVRFGAISNPRNGQAMRDFGFGVQAIPDLIGGDADISRFDMVVAAASGEVDPSAINTVKQAEITHKYTSDLCNLLIRWAWSRKSTHIIFQPGTVEQCYKLATEMGEVFDSSIPLVLAQSQRLKLARIAAAIATSLFSTEDGEHVLVHPDHVEAAHRFLMEDFTKASMGYHAYSAVQRRTTVLPNTGGVKRLLDENSFMLYECLITNRTFQRKTIDEYTGENRAVVDLVFRDLIRLRCIHQKRNLSYALTPAFIKFLATYTHPDAAENKYAQDSEFNTRVTLQ